MQTNLKGLPEEAEQLGARPSLLPSADGRGEALEAQDLNAVLRRMKEIARVLEHFQDFREEGRSRSDYMEQVGLSLKSSLLYSLPAASVKTPLLKEKKRATYFTY